MERLWCSQFVTSTMPRCERKANTCSELSIRPSDSAIRGEPNGHPQEFARRFVQVMPDQRKESAVAFLEAPPLQLASTTR
jgi:hypothetical protein